MKLEEERLVLPLTISNIVKCNCYTDSALKRIIHFENDHIYKVIEVLSDFQIENETKIRSILENQNNTLRKKQRLTIDNFISTFGNHIQSRNITTTRLSETNG